MADNKQTACMTCEPKGLCGGKGLVTLKEGAWANNPLAIQVLGICSALAVTNRLENSLVMGAALIFVCVGSNLLVSLLRKVTPYRFRMIAEVAIIATALQNPPVLSIVDGIANGLGYAVVLAIIGFFRELLGAGEILGREIPGFSSWYTPNQLMILAPGAFFALGVVIGIFNWIKGPEPEEKK
jgi:Na+-transporting NADH:ubiquinone oxidoreductase subunit D